MINPHLAQPFLIISPHNKAINISSWVNCLWCACISAWFMRAIFLRVYSTKSSLPFTNPFWSRLIITVNLQIIIFKSIFEIFHIPSFTLPINCPDVVQSVFLNLSQGLFPFPLSSKRSPLLLWFLLFSCCILQNWLYHIIILALSYYYRYGITLHGYMISGLRSLSWQAIVSAGTI